MKPNRLTICGINSYVTPQTIDFKKLSEGNLFGIFGATGSGKSTILDAMVIALYGTSDRDNLSNIINVNVKDAYIKFEFEIERNHEQSVVEVVRNFKMRPSGLTSGATLTNLTTNQVLADSTDKVNDVLEKMLGVSKKEFLKCVALPQNEFDKFLLDTPAERKKSVAKLFNLEHFGEDLNRKVKSRLEILNAKDVAITEQLKTFEGITDETQNELLKQITELENFVLSPLSVQIDCSEVQSSGVYELPFSVILPSGINLDKIEPSVAKLNIVDFVEIPIPENQESDSENVEEQKNNNDSESPSEEDLNINQSSSTTSDDKISLPITE
jgi:DNA repair exonuclease SbcCD ATPase subunit